MKSTARTLAVSACTAFALAAGIALADDMKVGRDKDSGNLRPATPDEIAAMQGKGFAPSAVVQARPTTSVLVRSDGSAVARRSADDLDNLVYTRDANGKAVLRHTRKGTPAVQAPAADLPKE